ncbi:MAG: F0F1 ATP synthase subunit B [Planctomycetaceae bacterium]|jgi:F-type H+-transporting ATPase subunit b|nr:F0F1 ATP synthase subunit B [Planctomycetaceae bacterium]
MTRYAALFAFLLIAGATGFVFAGTSDPISGTASHGGETSLNPMEWATNTALWTLIIFLTVFGILYKLGFGPIAKALDDREQGILDKIASAQQQNEEAKVLLKQYQEKLDRAKDEVRLIIENAKKDALRQAEDIAAKAREAADQERSRATKEIESATVSALQSIAERSAVLAANLAGKMIRASIKPEQHRSLIDAALEEFTRADNTERRTVNL